MNLNNMSIFREHMYLESKDLTKIKEILKII